MRGKKIILGLDPGTNIMGFGLIEIQNDNIKLIQYGIINLKKYQDHSEKLQMIFENVNNLIRDYNPGAISIESPFFGKNVQSMLKLGRAQGVAMVAGKINGIKISEYAPRKIKKSVTGNGNASKEQLSEIIKKTLNIKDQINKKLDASDALGAALCHYYQKSNNESPRKSWKKFIQANPDKIV
ncbi:MAG: crossover junction endodeoxyribonuclease RuvC [Flammeovirgaceae bacterium]|nr:crossover junction endodeoxyribonuclease RuvC [Flammeovirgaceae bacterium]|tara:strand:+ start:464 stop:1012 length:549 start_codon:yes stop_codon:yes gene_type:complete